MGPLLPYRVKARNIAPDSDNRIHADDVAQQYGFRGGLVPGVVVHAYLTHPAAAAWGIEWLETGTIRSRFLRPVYDGDDVLLDVEDEEPGSPVSLVSLVARAPSSDRAAVAGVGPPDRDCARRAKDTLNIARWPHRDLPARAQRPPASEEAFASTPVLGSLDVRFHRSPAAAYLDSIGEELSLYRAEGVAHPGWLLAQANYVLAANVALGPWIHVESEVQHLGLVRDGDLISTRAVVLGTSERRGHRYVELDTLIVDERERPVVRARHVAIYEPRRPEAGKEGDEAG